ncbi:MAG TPA: hypothetical protein VGF14_05400 [Alphaproteobacteria bacterium]
MNNLIVEYERLNKTALWTWIICNPIVIISFIIKQTPTDKIRNFVVLTTLFLLFTLIVSAVLISLIVFLSRLIYDLIDNKVPEFLYAILYLLIPLGFSMAFLIWGYLKGKDSYFDIGSVFLWIAGPYLATALVIYGIFSLRGIPLKVEY